MKRNLIAVLSVTASFLFASCGLFTSKKAESSNPLLGKWKIDSIATGADSSALGYLLLAMSVDDSAAFDYQFEKDTVTFYGKGNERIKSPYEFIKRTQQLIIKDSTMEAYDVRSLNDSITRLESKDSSVIFLKKR